MDIPLSHHRPVVLIIGNRDIDDAEREWLYARLNELNPSRVPRSKVRGANTAAQAWASDNNVPPSQILRAKFPEYIDQLEVGVPVVLLGFEESEDDAALVEQASKKRLRIVTRRR